MWFNAKRKLPSENDAGQQTQSIRGVADAVRRGVIEAVATARGCMEDGVGLRSSGGQGAEFADAFSYRGWEVGYHRNV